MFSATDTSIVLREYSSSVFLRFSKDKNECVGINDIF